MYQGDTQFDENCSIQVDPPRYDTLGRNYPGQTAHARPALDAMARATAPQPFLPLATDHGQQSQGRLETLSFQTHQVPQSAHAQDMCNLTQLFQQMLSVQLSFKGQIQQELNEMKQQQRAQQERLLQDTREQYDQFDRRFKAIEQLFLAPSGGSMCSPTSHAGSENVFEEEPREVQNTMTLPNEGVQTTISEHLVESLMGVVPVSSPNEMSSQRPLSLGRDTAVKFQAKPIIVSDTRPISQETSAVRYSHIQGESQIIHPRTTQSLLDPYQRQSVANPTGNSMRNIGEPVTSYVGIGQPIHTSSNTIWSGHVHPNPLARFTGPQEPNVTFADSTRTTNVRGPSNDPNLPTLPTHQPVSVSNSPCVSFSSGTPQTPVSQGSGYFGHRKPATYDGSSSWKDHLVQFELVADLNRWPEDIKALELAASLRGVAQGVLSDLPADQRKHYTSLVNRLTARFEPENQSEIYRARLKTGISKKDEDLGTLAQEISRLVRKAYPSVSIEMQDRFDSMHLLMLSMIQIWSGLCIKGIQFHCKMPAKLHTNMKLLGQEGVERIFLSEAEYKAYKKKIQFSHLREKLAHNIQ